jgi:hypothetical protein
MPLASALSVQATQRRCDVDRLVDVDLELGQRVRDGLVTENLASFLADPSPETTAAARTCSGIAVAGRAATARRLGEIRAAWASPTGVAR